MTLAALSTASGVSPAVISKLERNQQSAELDTLYRLGRAFGMSATDLLALAESPLAHRSSEKPSRSGEFRFRQVKYANVVALLGSAPAGAKVSRPEIHHDDTEVCWVTTGKLRDRKSTRLNSSHQIISYAVFCLKKKQMAAVNFGRTQAWTRHNSRNHAFA